MKTRSKARINAKPGAKAKKQQVHRPPSPDWDINSQDFSRESRSPLGSPEPANEGPPDALEKESSPYVPSPGSPSPPDQHDKDSESESGTEDVVMLPVNTTQSQNARSPPWLPWHDRSLIQTAERLRPFSAPRGDATKNAWDDFAVELLKDSTANGTRINRTGAACRARFQKLLKAHKADQTRSLQKTGTDEEVDQHIELMSQIADLVHAHELEKDVRSAASRKKDSVEVKAASELRDAAMKGLVRREALTDVAQLEGASLREKQGQRKHKRTRAEGSDKENSDDDVKPKRKRARNQLLEIVQQRNVIDSKQLEKARELDERRHRELQQLQQRSLDTQQTMLAGFEKLTAGVTALVEAQAKQAAEDNRRRYEESERRREDAERRAAESERHASLLLALTNNKN